MKILYIGSLPNGSVDWPGGTFNFVAGEPVEVPDELGKDLIRTETWREADAKTPRRRER